MSVAIEDIPISPNPTERESRLVRSTPAYVRRNAFAIFRAYTLYEPLRVFMILAAVFGVLAFAAWSPFLADWILHGDRSGHIQSLILGAVLMLAAVQMFALGIIGDSLAGQRTIAQRVYRRVRRLELEAGIAPAHYEPGDPTRELTVEKIEAASAREHRGGRRQRLRQVRDGQSNRAPARRRLHVAAGRPRPPNRRP